MGALAIPAQGEVYLDTNVLIYSVETQPKYWPLLEPLWIAASSGIVTIISSELVILESLVGPIRSGDQGTEIAYESVFRSRDVRLIPISQSILRSAAQLRAAHSTMRSPDAIHAATGLSATPALFVTNDTIFRRVPNLPTVILDDLLATP